MTRPSTKFPIIIIMASPVKKSKGKRQREADSLTEWPESEIQPSPKKGRLIDRPKDPQELQTTEPRKELSPKKSHLTKSKTKNQIQTPPQMITDAPKTPKTPAAAERLGLDSDVAKQLLKNGGGLSSLTSMILEAGKMMVEQGLPDTDAQYKSMLSELVKNMVTFSSLAPSPPRPLFFFLSFLNHY